jgi:HD-like signal output (HDOD) protein
MNTAAIGLGVLASQGVRLTATDLLLGLVVALGILVLLFAFSITGSFLEKKDSSKDDNEPKRGE